MTSPYLFKQNSNQKLAIWSSHDSNQTAMPLQCLRYIAAHSNIAAVRCCPYAQLAAEKQQRSVASAKYIHKLAHPSNPRAPRRGAPFPTMDDLSRKFKAFDWKGLQKQAKKVQASTASALKDLVMTDLENKVRAATGDTNWGASGADLAEIAQGTYNREDFTLIMSILWQRLASTRWRCVYKALDVLRYIVLHGASRVLEETREALAHIRRLEHFAHIDTVTRRDEGANVRARAAAFVAILTDEALLEEERTKSAALRAKIGVAVPSNHYTHTMGSGGGLSSDDYRFGAASRQDYDDKPAARTMHTPKPTFNGNAAAAAPPQPAFNSTVDDLLGGFESVPALPAPEPKQQQPAGLGLAELGVFDDVPAQRAALPLMAAAPPAGNVPPMFGADEDDDDDDFDPRASAHAGGAMPTSMLIANLAAARSTAADAAARTETPATPLSAMQREAAEQSAAPLKPKEDVAYGGLVHFENLMLDKTTRVESKIISPTNVPVMPVRAVAAATAVEKDPFGDLLSTAKKSGVL